MRLSVTVATVITVVFGLGSAAQAARLFTPTLAKGPTDIDHVCVARNVSSKPRQVTMGLVDGVGTRATAIAVVQPGGFSVVQDITPPDIFVACEVDVRSGVRS